MTEERIREIVDQGSGRIPCSHYAREDGSDLADWVIMLDGLMTEATGEESTDEGIEHLVSMVVNSHEDVEYLVREYGNPNEWLNR